MAVHDLVTLFFWFRYLLASCVCLHGLLCHLHILVHLPSGYHPAPYTAQPPPSLDAKSLLQLTKSMQNYRKGTSVGKAHTGIYIRVLLLNGGVMVGGPS